jgi:2-polyprenyl-3-methyl-5-hydroxy-6-metoxy-1,4-benzoquinol methylase
MKIIKTALRNIFKKLGYDVRKIHDFGYQDAVEYNSQAAVDKYYADAALVEHYINTEVQAQLHNIKYWLDAAAIDLNGKRVLDAGCGTGHCLQYLSKLYPKAQLFGTEYTDSSLKIAKKLNENAKIALLSIYDEWPNQKFDSIFCQLVFEHLEYPETAAQTLWAMLNSGGFLLITVPDGRQDNFTGHIHFWSKESFKLFLLRQFPENTSIAIGFLQDDLSLFAYIKK